MRGILVLALLWTAPATANQDDVPLTFDRPDALFDGEAGVRGMVGATGVIDITRYLVGGSNHRWHGRVGGEIALLSLGPDVHFRMGLSAQTVADDENSINFRLVRLYYEVPIAFDWRVGPGVATVALRHRCAHGADGAVEDRILINTTVDLGYRAGWRFGALELTATANLATTMVGQNKDTAFQPRILTTLTAGLIWHATTRLEVLAGAGLGAMIFGAGPADDEGVYLVSDSWGDLNVDWLPVAAAGVGYKGDGATMRLQLHLSKIADTGIGTTRRSEVLLAPRLSFAF